VPRELWAFACGLYRGEAQRNAALIGLCSLAIIVIFRRSMPKVPGVAVAVVGSIAAASIFDLTSRGVTVIGVVPSGLPPFSLPDINAHDLATLVVAAVGLAFVALADTAPISRSLALKRGELVDPNREMVAIGAANIAAGLFQGFPISASVSRSAVAEANGARSQLTGATGGLAIIVLLVAAHGLLRNLPTATLAAILVSAAIGLFDLASMRWLWKVRKSELVLSLTAMVAVGWLGPLRGIGVAVVLAVVDFLRREWRPHSTVLGRLSDRSGYHDILRHPNAVQAPGLVLFRFDAPLFFANSDHFAATVRKSIADRTDPIQWVIIAAEPITDVDTTSAEMLTDLLDELEARSITFGFAEMKGHVKDRLHSYGLFDRIGEQMFFPTIGNAMKTYYLLIGVANPADNA
jgi:MFS superfamily sulfate permease-like transporter